MKSLLLENAEHTGLGFVTRHPARHSGAHDERGTPKHIDHLAIQGDAEDEGIATCWRAGILMPGAAMYFDRGHGDFRAWRQRDEYISSFGDEGQGGRRGRLLSLAKE